MISCDNCAYYEYDEDWESYVCAMDMDEDDFNRVVSGGYKDCPYYVNDDEYAVVRHQI